MPLETIGVVFLVLLVVFIGSKLWFHMVEGLLGLLKRLFTKKKPPPAWHTLPKDEE